jgi:polyferredoxin
LFLIGTSLAHNLIGETTGLPIASAEALCPFGAIEAFYRFITSGLTLPKTHLSNLVLGTAVLIGLLLAGNAFCGWVCPFGALQDLLDWIRRKLHLPTINVPEKLDGILRYGRFAVLALILYMTITSVKLWFADYDPFRTIFGLGWLFEFNLAESWPAYLIAISFIVLALLIPRFWCKYTCPLGAVMSLGQHLSLLRIRRNASSCKGCAICNKPCPVGIKVAQTKNRVSANCIGCLECVEVCPRKGALEVQFAPVWLPLPKQPEPPKPSFNVPVAGK